MGSRDLFHGGAQGVLSPKDIQAWIKLALTKDWKKLPDAAFATVMMARVTNDRARDLDPEEREKIVYKLEAAKAPELWKKLVMEYQELDEKESKRMFGEALPSGLRLLEKQ